MGADLQFAPGLVVLRADNSTGKSTSLQAVIFALGLEGMLSPSHAIPLPHAMTHRVTDPDTGTELSVLESEVLLEIENGDGRVATVRRYPRHTDISSNLVTVFESAGLTSDQWDSRRDYFVRVPGAAQRESGFHQWLVNFLGWELPDVPRFKGLPVPLYVETIFPLFVVEQKRGWAGILSRVPTHFQIRDAQRRAVEFVLKLQASNIALERQRLEGEIQHLRSEWQNTAIRATAAAQVVGGLVQNLPSLPVAIWPPSAAPAILIPLRDGWHPVESEMTRVALELIDMRRSEVPRADDAAPGIEARLRELNVELQSVAQLYDELDRDLSLDQEELGSLRRRHEHLAEELRRTQDAALLRRLGSPLQDWIEMEDCPTCHQHLPEALLSAGSDLQLITLAEAEARIRQQIELVQALERDLEGTVSAKSLKTTAVEARVHELQRAVRSAKQALVAPADSPSVAHVQQMLELERRTELLATAAAAFKSVVSELEPLVERWRTAQAALRSLHDVDLAEEDETKLRRLEELLVSQLKDYGFRSLPADEIKISLERYTPTHEGFDLGFDLSASDMIRLIWAYLLGLLELAREHTTNHVNLLLLDEPRQQSTDPVAFRTLLHRASAAGAAGQQVVFATSEPDADMRAMLVGTSHTYLSYDGFILRRRDN